MRSSLSIIFTISMFISFVSAQGEWSTLKTGAGGWITGMDIQPDGTIYIRSDVGGAYRLDTNSNEWEQLVTSGSMPANELRWSRYQGVQSISCSSSDPSRVYMAYDDGVFRSSNKGDSWQRTNLSNVIMYANDDNSKLSGERLAVDPNNPDVVYLGSINDGLFVTNDGMNWSNVSGVPSGMPDRGIRTVLFDPTSAVLNGKTSVIYLAIDGEGIFKSSDAGENWDEISQNLFSNSNPWIYDFEIDNSGNIYICGEDEDASGNKIPFGAYKYDGTTWNQIFNEDLQIAYSELAIDPNDNNRVLIFSYGYSETYRTTNAQSNAPNWAYLTTQKSAQNIPWLAWTASTWFTLGEIKFDPIVENKLWITYGTGTFYAIDDGTEELIWNEWSNGQEHLVSNDVIHFGDGQKLSAHWDFCIFKHDANNNYPNEHLPSSRFNSCWDLSQSPSDENFVVALIEDIRYCCWDDASRNSGYSEDAGLTWTKFPSMPEGEFDLVFGQIEVSALDNNNLIWLPGGNRNPFVTFDKGSSWTEVDLPGDSADCCIGAPWFKRKALVADQVGSGKFYIYDWGSGDVFYTADGGLSWDKNANVLPAWSFNAKLISVPGQEGHLLFCNGPEEAADFIEGLFISTDGGQSFTELNNTDEVLNVTVGKTAPDANYPTVYICGKVDGNYGYFMSSDQGASWTNIGDYPLGIYDWPSVMEANPHEYGNLTIGFAGNGFVDYQASSSSMAVETERIHIDQFGYKPSFTKVAVISNPQIGYNSSESYTPGSTLQVIDASDLSVVYSGTASIWNGGQTHGQSGDQGWHFDFTGVTDPGSYYILDVDNNLKSYEFDISDDVYNEVLKASTKMFYYNRCNMEKAMPFAEANWVDGDNFNNHLQDENARYIYDQGNASLEKDLSGGWFDAGDYNKYVTFAHGAIHNLLSAFDENANVFGDNWNIPESNNGIPDLLDEINWELQWLEKMYNADGSVHIKMGSKNYSENVSSPPSQNFDQRYYGPVCTAASIAVASMFAHAAVSYQTVSGLSNYATNLEAKAIQAFNYYLTALNSNSLDTECDDGSIVSGDADWAEDVQKRVALIAAVYLFELTGNNIYGDYVINNINDAEFVSTGWMGPYMNPTVEALFYYTTLPNSDANTNSAIINSIFPHVSQDWDGFYGQNNLDLYRSYIPDWSYHWGSNQVKADYGNLNQMVAKYDINPPNNASYLKKAEELLHYYHGINPQTKVYLSNMESRGAENSVDELYHTWFADGTDYDNVNTSLYGPAPGFIPGGANQNYSYSGNVPPYGQPAQKSYLDFNTSWPDASWEITEPAIYYQAAYVRLLSSFVSQQSSVPLTLLSFEAEKQGDDAHLTWETENEINTESFEIESSIDGLTFDYIGELASNNLSGMINSYEYFDEDLSSNYPGANMIFYRLKMLDQDGSFEYSPVRSIGVSKSDLLFDPLIQIFPNPSLGNIYIKQLADENLSEIGLFGLLGQRVLFKELNSNLAEIDVSNLPSGQYLAVVKSGNTVEKKKLILAKN